MADFIQRERDSGSQYLADLLATARRVYLSALDFDGIAPDTMFAVFSADNPFVYFYDKVLTEYREARASYFALGYVGMSIGGAGRAELYTRPKRRKVKGCGDGRKK